MIVIGRWLGGSGLCVWVRESVCALMLKHVTQAADMTKALTRVNMHSGKVNVRKVNVSNKVYTYNRHKGLLHLSFSTSVHCQRV